MAKAKTATPKTLEATLASLADKAIKNIGVDNVVDNLIDDLSYGTGRKALETFVKARMNK